MRGSPDRLSYVKDPENYSDLQVLHSSGGYYVGTLYTSPDVPGLTEPGSRDSGYYKTRREAEEFLELLESLPVAVSLCLMRPNP